MRMFPMLDESQVLLSMVGFGKNIVMPPPGTYQAWLRIAGIVIYDFF